MQTQPHQQIPHNFYELELKNPKRNTGFATVGKNLLNNLQASKIGKLKLEEELINDDEHRKQEEVEYYQNLVMKI